MAYDKPGRAPEPRFTRWEVPRDWADAARNRTAYLATPHLTMVQPYREALVNAYLQGVADAVEAMGDTDASPYSSDGTGGAHV